MTTLKFHIEDLKNLWRYHENVQRICTEVNNSEFAEIPVVSFVLNGGANDFIQNIIPPLNLPPEGVRIATSATEALMCSFSITESRVDEKKVLGAFNHFSNVVELLADNLCNSSRGKK